jgi:hypothetical protein
VHSRVEGKIRIAIYRHKSHIVSTSPIVPHSLQLNSKKSAQKPKRHNLCDDRRFKNLIPALYIFSGPPSPIIQKFKILPKLRTKLRNKSHALSLTMLNETALDAAVARLDVARSYNEVCKC